MAIKWKNNKCSGVFEVEGKLFKQIRCINRCEAYLDKPCSYETHPDISSLVPDEVNTNLYFFNKKLLDYGEYGSFEGICAEFELEKTEDGKYWTAPADNLLRMMLINRNLMFVLFCNITGDVTEQREVIFKDFTVDEHWYKLLDKSPDFYLDYSVRVDHSQSFSNAQWLEICKKFPVLYNDVTTRERCVFSDAEMVELLAIHPDLDTAAYNRIKEHGMSSDLWVTLLAGGTGGSRDRFWADCPFDKLSGNNWITLLSDRKLSAQAGKYLKREYGFNFSDSEWIALKKAGFKGKFDHPGFMKFKPFYKNAPKHAAKAQFNSMIGIVFAGTFAVLVGGLIATGNFSFITILSFLAIMCYSALWAVGASWGFSRRRGGNTGMIINSVILSVFGGWIFPHSLLLLNGFIDCSDPISITAVTLFLEVLVLAVLAVCGMIHRAVAYVFMALLTLGYIFMSINAPVKGHLAVCSNSRLYTAYNYYLEKYLAKHDFSNRWKNACGNGDAEAVKDLYSTIWVPEPCLKDKYEDALEQLIDGILANPGKLDNVYKEWFINHDYAGKYFTEKIIKEENAAVKLRYAQLFRKLDAEHFNNNQDLRKHIFQYACNRISLGNIRSKVLLKCLLFDLIKDNLTSDMRKDFFDNLREQIIKSKNYPFSLEEIKKLSEYPEMQTDDNKDFWVNLALRESVGAFYDSMKNHLASNKFNKNIIAAIEEEYKVKWGKKSEDLYRKFLQATPDEARAEAMRAILEHEKPEIKQYLQNNKKNDFLFWAGWYYYYSQNDEKTLEHWEKCLGTIKNPVPGSRISQKINNDLRNKLAELLLPKAEKHAVDLWTVCYNTEHGNIDKKIGYLKKILEYSDAAGKVQYLVKACQDKSVQQRDELKEYTNFLLECIKKTQNDRKKSQIFQSILNMYGNNVGNLPETLREQLNSLLLSGQYKSGLSKFMKTFAQYYMNNSEWQKSWNLLRGFSRESNGSFIENSFKHDAKKQGEAFFQFAMLAKGGNANFEQLYDDFVANRNAVLSPYEKAFPNTNNSPSRYFMDKAIEKKQAQAMILKLCHMLWDSGTTKPAISDTEYNQFRKDCERAAGNDENLKDKIEQL